MSWNVYETGNRESKCSTCGAIIGLSQRRYWEKETRRVLCSTCYDDEHTHNVTVTQAQHTPSPLIPPSTTDRNAVTSKAHDDNMKSAEANRLALQSLTSAIVDFMRVEEDRNKLLRQNMEAKA